MDICLDWLRGTTKYIYEEHTEFTKGEKIKQGYFGCVSTTLGTSQHYCLPL